MNWVATVTIHCADRCVGDKAQKDGILSFRGAHFLRLRSATFAPIPPPASAASLQYSRSSVCSIHPAGQRRLEKAADALKVSWGLPPCGISRPRHLEAAAGQAGPSFGHVFLSAPRPRVRTVVRQIDGIFIAQLKCPRTSTVLPLKTQSATVGRRSSGGYGRILARDGANAGWIN